MKYCPRYLPVTSNPHRKTGLGDKEMYKTPEYLFPEQNNCRGRSVYQNTHTQKKVLQALQG